MTQKRVKASDVIGNSYYIYTLQSSNNTPSLNSTINITCNVTDVYGQAVSGKSITLYQNNTSKGAKTTDSNGNASWNSISMSSAGLQTFKVENSKIEIFVDNKSDVGHTHSQYLTEHQSLDNYVTTDDSRLSDSRTPTSHTHGNINNNGTMTVASSTMASNAQYIVYSDSANGALKRTDLVPASYIRDSAAHSSLGTGAGATQDTINNAISSKINDKLDKVQSSYKGKNVVTNASTGTIEFEDKPTIPSASSTTPSADTTNGSVGTGTTWARADHKHPKSTLYAEASHDHTTSDITNFPTLHTVATSGSYNDLSNKPNIPSKTSDLTNDSGYLTSHQDISNKENIVELITGTQDTTVTNRLLGTTTKLNSLQDGDKLLLKTPATANSYGTGVYLRITLTNGSTNDSLICDENGDNITRSNIPENTILLLMYKASSPTKWLIVNKNFNGDYNNLTNKPTIPSKTSDLTNDSGFLTSHQSLSGYLQTSDVKDNLTSTDTNKPLSANQGKTLKTLIDGKANSTHNHTKSQITDFPTSMTPTSHTHGNLQNNGQVGSTAQANKNVVTDSSGKITTENKPTIPSKTSDLTNDTGFLTSHQDISGKEDSSNKVSSWNSTTNNIRYPTEKLVKDSLDNKLDKTQTSYKGKNVVTNASTGAIEFEEKNNHTHSNYLTSSDISGKIDTAGTGLSKSGTTLNHSNSITALTTESFKKIKYDAQGHITGTANVSASDLPSHTHNYSTFSGSYNDLTDKPNIPEGVVVDTGLSSSSNNAIANSTVNTALSGKAPTSHASSATTYGVGTTSNYGHVKTINGLTQSSHSNGTALSAYQGYVLKQAIDGKANSTHSHSDLSQSIQNLGQAISELSEVATSGDYDDLINTPKNLSYFNDDVGYLTSHQSLSNYYNKSETNNYDVDFILGTQTESTSAWTGTTDIISSLREGTTIFYKLPYASTSTSVTLNLTLKGGGTTGAKNVFYKNTTRLTTHFGVGQVVGLTYDGTAWYVISPSDNNSNNDSNYGGIQFKAGEALTTQTICCAKDNGQYYKVANGVVLDIRYPLIMTSSAVTSGTITNAMYRTWYGVNIANTKSMTLTNGSQLFLEGTDYSDGKFTISSNVVTHTLTNGRYYINVGTALSTTQIRFISDMTVYYYNGTTLKPVIKKEQIVDFPTIPSASSTVPSADTTNGSYGSGTNYARSNHTHPKSSLYAESSHTHSQYLTSHQDISGKVDKNDFNVDYVHSFTYNNSTENYGYQNQSGAVGIGVSAIDIDDNSPLLNENGVAIIDLVFQNTNINYGSIQLVLAEANGRKYSDSSSLSNTQTIATITDTNKHHITIVVSPDTHIEEQGYDYYDLKVSKISYDGSNITISSGKTRMEEVGVYIVFNGSIGGNIEYMNVIKRTPIVNQIIDIIYPIGSTYISVNSVNPSFLFGGTWEQIQDRFLLASGSTYSAGSTGGEATHKLTVNEMPSHTHIQNQHRHELNRNFSDGSGGTISSYITTADRKTSTKYTTYTTPTNQNTGGGQAHNNMPPYLTVYMWKRIA